MISTTELTRELLYQVRLGEDSAYEFKRVAMERGRLVEPHPHALADELAAFANAAGGWLVCGVDDKPHGDGAGRRIVGLPLADLDPLDLALANLATQSIAPALTIETRHLELPDASGVMHAVVAVRVPKSPFVHKSPNGYFQRIGSTKREMSPELLARLFQQRSMSRLVRFDESALPNAPLAMFGPALAERFVKPGQSALDALQKLYLAARTDDGALVLTVTGALLLLPRPADVLPSAYVQCVAYGGTARDAERQLDARDCDGPLDAQIAEAFAFVRRNMRIEAVKRPGRIDIPQYAERAVYEAIVNAAVHRDYSLVGARIRLHLFADRLEIASPGGLPNTLSVDTIDANSITRNETLVNLLARYYPADAASGRQNLVERRGEGVPTILDASEALSLRRPRYENLDHTELKLTIWAASRERNGLAPRAGDAADDDDPLP